MKKKKKCFNFRIVEKIKTNLFLLNFLLNCKNWIKLSNKTFSFLHYLTKIGTNEKKKIKLVM